MQPCIRACGHGGSHSSDFEVHVYGGNVPDALTYPQWANAGQVLLKIQNKTDTKRRVQLRSILDTNLYFHVERVRVKDQAEDLENFSFDSGSIFLEDGREDHEINFRCLNDAKFKLERKSSKLDDFKNASLKSGGVGEILNIQAKSKGPEYFLLPAMTTGITKVSDCNFENKVSFEFKQKLPTATYFHVNDVKRCASPYNENNVVKYRNDHEKTGFFHNQFAAPVCETKAYKLAVYGYTGKKGQIHLDAEADFKEKIFTSRTFRVGKLNFGVVKGYKEVIRSNLPKEVYVYFQRKQASSKRVYQVLHGG